MPNTNNTKRYQDVIKGFTLIDDEGYRYTFGRYSFLNGNVHTGQNAIEYSISFLQQYSWVAGQNPFFNEWIATAWHMTKVEDFNMNTIFELSYERSYFTAQLYNTLYVQEKFCSDADGGLSASHGNSNTVEGDYQANGALISNSYLKEIKSNKGEQLEFIRSNAIQKKFDWNFQFATYTQFVLCPLIQCVDNYPYPFLQYPGYYSFNPQQALSNPLNGLMWMKLDTIIYRKNYIGQNTYIINGIKLEYNNNANERLNLQSVHIIGNDILTNSNANKHSYVMEYNNFSQLPDYLTRKFDHFGYYDGTNDYMPTTLGAFFNFSLWQLNYYNSRNSSLYYAKIGQLTSMKFPTGGKTEFDFELHDYSSILSDDRQSIVGENGSIGGLRIREIRYFDDITSNYVKRSRYFYKLGYHNNGNLSSGILSIKPRYVWDHWELNTAWSPSHGYWESKVSENNLIPLTNLYENPVSYREVTEVNEDNSFMTNTFISHVEIKDQLPYTNLIPEYSPYSEFTDMGFYRGRQKETYYYSSDNTLVKSKKYYYNLNSISNSNEYGITTDAAVAYVCLPLNANYAFYGSARKIYHKKLLLDSMTTTEHYGPLAISVRESLRYTGYTINGNVIAFLMQKSITNSDGKVFMDYYKYPFDHTSSYPGQQAHMTSLVNAHRFPVVYKEKKVNGIVFDIQENLFSLFDGKPMISNVKRRECTWDVNGAMQCADDDASFVDNYNMIYLLPIQSRKKGWLAENLTLGYRGLVTGWNFSNHSKTYNYHQNDFLGSITDVDGQQSTFEYDLFGRLKKSTLYPKNLTNTYNYHFSTSSADKSYFKTNIKYPLSTDSAIDSVVHITYLDGLGREIQQVHKYGAPDAANDVISKTEYDLVGRPYRNYERIEASSNHGAYYNGTFGGGYSQTLYEANPLDRISQTTPPAWYITNHTYGTNTVPLTNPEGSTYPVSSLMRTTTTDPDSKSTDVYTDKIGRTVLQRQRDASNTTDTWTVYDDKSRPIKIYPPGTSPSTPDIIFEYRYDGDDNVIYKKVPDATAEEYRYSARNLQTAMRNATLQAQGRWKVTHYDAYGRAEKCGYHTGSDPGTSETPTIHTLLEEYFYDGYNGSTTNAAPIYKGKLKKSRIKVLEDGGANSNWVETEYNYDSYGRVETETITNHLGGTESKTYTYDFADNPTTETHIISGANGINHVTKHSYDHQGRKKYDHINLNGTGERTLAECNYDHKNQIIERNLGRHATTGTHQYLQSLDYTYNAQGWLTQINQPTPYYGPEIDPCLFLNKGPAITKTQGAITNTDDTDLFYLKLDYDLAPVGSGVTANQNGNITTMSWGHRFQTNGTLAYNYKYDHLNRVTEALQGTRSGTTVYLQNRYDEKFQYDTRGNITRLDRKAMIYQPQINYYCFKPQTIDSLTYTIWPGTNKLAHVQDKAPCIAVITLPPVIDRDMQYAATQEIRIEDTDVRCGVNLKLIAGNEIKIIDSLHIPSCGALVQTYTGPCTDAKYTEGFNQQSVNRLYEYDGGGNMTYDPNKKLTFYYNYHNLPYRIVGAENDQLQLLYASDGSLLQRKYLKNNIVITKTDYLRGVEYKSDTLESVHHPDGRAIKSGSDWIYEYWIKDHLGNVRVTYRDKNGDNIIDFSDQGSTSVHNYYTFGMEWINLADTLQPRNLYRYNGKEMIEEMDLNLAGYGARMMDPILGRFINVDPLADQFPGYSPYNYVLNNPIKLIDPDGRAPSDYDNEYVIDKNTGKTVEVSKAGGNEVDIIHSGTINDDGSIVVDPTQTQVVQVETISNPNIEYGGYRAPGLNIVPGANPAIPTTSSPIDAIPLIASNGGRAILNYVVNELKGLIISPAKPKSGSSGGPGAGKPFSEKTKDAAEAQAGGRCVFCQNKTDRTPGSPNRRNTDHADPKSRGGNNTLPNAQNTCQTCNQNKGTMTTGEYLMHLLNRR